MSRFKLPLEKGMLLTREMLNSYSRFRRPKKPYFISVFKCHYQEHFKSFKEQMGKVYDFV